VARTEKDEERLRAEIEAHIALQAEDNLRAGLSPEESRRQAILKFGAVEAVKEEYRDERGLPSVEALLHDMRYASRRLRRCPAFTVTVVLTLALGIGATTSIFTLVYAVLLKSLAVADPAELYRLGKEARCCYWGGYSQENEFSLVSYDLYKHFRDHTQGFRELAAFQASTSLLGVRRSGSAEAAQGYPGEFVSGNYFTMFGISAYAGRLLTAGDDQAGAPPAAVMSYRLWQQRYESDPSVVGGVFNIDDKPFTVVGITPPRFFGDTLRTNPPDFFLPINTQPLLGAAADIYQSDNSWLDLIGRILPGANPASIEAQMRAELKQWLRSRWGDMSANDRAEFPEQTLFLRPGGAGITSMREEYEHWLQILMMVTSFVLLIVCERRQSDARARHGAAAGDIVEDSTGGAGAPAREAGPRRKHFALTRRWCGGSGDCICGDAPYSALRISADERNGSYSHRRVVFHAGPALCLRRFADRGSYFRHRSGVDDHTDRSHRSPPGS